MRDREGKWISGYNRCLGKCSIFYVELRGILDGLNIMSKKFENVLIQTNSVETTKAIQWQNHNVNIGSGS